MHLEKTVTDEMLFFYLTTEQWQVPRVQGCLPEPSMVYTKGKRFNFKESVSTEFKDSTEAISLITSKETEKQEKGWWKFGKEITKFVCAIFNARILLATIYFGVADGHAKNAKKKDHKPCEIIGLNMTDELIAAFEEKFDGWVHLIKYDTQNPKGKCQALQYIMSPYFIPVRHDGRQNLYIIEIDVRPRIAFTQGKLFVVHPPKPMKNLKKTDSSKKDEEKMANPVAYRRDLANSLKMDKEETNLYKEEVDQYDAHLKEQLDSLCEKHRCIACTKKSMSS